jgi:hypothetical protein
MREWTPDQHAEHRRTMWEMKSAEEAASFARAQEDAKQAWLKELL